MWVSLGVLQGFMQAFIQGFCRVSFKVSFKVSFRVPLRFHLGVLSEQGIRRVRFCTPLCTFSVLTYALTGKKKQMTRLNSLHPSLGACKTKKQKSKDQNQTEKKNKKTNPMSQALWPSRSSWFSVLFVFLFFCLFFCFFQFFCFFGFC